MLIAAEVAQDSKNRSFEDIASKIGKLPLGELEARSLDMVRVADPNSTQM